MPESETVMRLRPSSETKSFEAQRPLVWNSTVWTNPKDSVDGEIPEFVKREDELDNVDEQEGPGVIGVKGNPIPPDSWFPFLLDEDGMRVFGIEESTRAELKSHQAIRSPTETS